MSALEADQLIPVEELLKAYNVVAEDSSVQRRRPRRVRFKAGGGDGSGDGSGSGSGGGEGEGEAGSGIEGGSDEEEDDDDRENEGAGDSDMDVQSDDDEEEQEGGGDTSPDDGKRWAGPQSEMVVACLRWGGQGALSPFSTLFLYNRQHLSGVGPC